VWRGGVLVWLRGKNQRLVAMIGVIVRRERRRTSAGATPAGELVRSTAAPIAFGCGDSVASVGSNVA